MSILKMFAIALFLGTSLHANAQKPLPQKDQFLFSIVELHKSESSSGMEVEVKSTKVIDKKLRFPTISETTEKSENYVRFQITDEAQNVLDEIIINDPFNVEYEYADEQGKLQRTTVAQDVRSVLIRRPISQLATTLRVQPHSTQRSSNPTIFKFR